MFCRICRREVSEVASNWRTNHLNGLEHRHNSERRRRGLPASNSSLVPARDSTSEPASTNSTRTFHEIYLERARANTPLGRTPPSRMRYRPYGLHTWDTTRWNPSPFSQQSESKPSPSPERNTVSSLSLTGLLDSPTEQLAQWTAKRSRTRVTTLEKLGLDGLRRHFISGHYKSCTLGKQCPASWWTSLRAQTQNDLLPFLGSMILAVHQKHSMTPSKTSFVSAMRLKAIDEAAGGPRI